MATSSLLLRRALSTASTSTLRRLTGASSVLSPPAPPSPCPSFHSDSSVQSQSRRYAVSPSILFHSRAYRASPASLLSARGGGGGGGGGDLDEIGPDTILFEGCDYNHWLIVMDFKDNDKPTPEEMVRTYEETCARGLNISVEEAKLKMYACSTTTYTGFQVVMTEEESERFNGVPGVVFVLPDSYIDPQNKEYGGDKYMNGTIIPRPPPIEYRRASGRYRDQPRYDARPLMPNQDSQHRGPVPSQQPNHSFNQQQYRPPQQNYPPPQQHYGPPGGRGPYQQGPPGGGGSYQQGPPPGTNPYQQGPPPGASPYQQGPPPQYQGNYNNGGGQGNYYPQDQRNYGPPPPPPNQQGGGGFRDDYGQGGLGGHQGPGGFRRN